MNCGPQQTTQRLLGTARVLQHHLPLAHRGLSRPTSQQSGSRDFPISLAHAIPTKTPALTQGSRIKVNPRMHQELIQTHVSENLPFAFSPPLHYRAGQVG